MKVIKRDGTIVEYNPEKIRIAIKKANNEVSRKEKATEADIEEIITYIEDLKKSTRHYAKRQITWFKNKLNCHYLLAYNNVSEMVQEIINDSNILEK